MFHNKKILCTVCARGGSKGVKNKNIRDLCGKPMICYSLDLISESKYIDDYVVSTDSDIIADVVKNYGYEVKFKRPDCLSGDKVSRLEVIQHACEWMMNYYKTDYDVVIDLGVATPLKTAEDVDNCIELLINTNCSNVFSVTPSSRNPYYNMVEEIDGKINKVKKLSDNITDRRDAPKVFDMNDGLNVWKKGTLFSDTPQFNTDTKIYIMPRERSVDVDEEVDFLIAEFFINRNANGIN